MADLLKTLRRELPPRGGSATGRGRSVSVSGWAVFEWFWILSAYSSSGTEQLAATIFLVIRTVSVCSFWFFGSLVLCVLTGSF